MNGGPSWWESTRPRPYTHVIPDPSPLKEIPVSLSQKTRNKIYGVVASLVPVAVILGFATSDQADQALSLTDNGLALAAAVLTWGTTVLAFVKSLPSKVRTVKADDPSTPV